MTEPTKSTMQVSPARLQVSDYEMTTFTLTVEKGTTKEDLINPAFWAHIAVKFRPWDLIYVRSDEGTFFAEYLVLSCGRNWAQVKEKSYMNLTSSDVSLTQAAAQDGYKVEWKGPHVKFAVIRNSDSAKIKDSFQTKEEAQTWLSDFEKQIA